jgi:TRAP-type C4-dicarboxylate transport system permease small subunit
VFGIFSVMALLTAKLPQKIRIVVAVIGELIVLITAFVMFKTVTTYMMMCSRTILFSECNTTSQYVNILL